MDGSRLENYADIHTVGVSSDQCSVEHLGDNSACLLCLSQIPTEDRSGTCAARCGSIVILSATCLPASRYCALVLNARAILGSMISRLGHILKPSWLCNRFTTMSFTMASCLLSRHQMKYGMYSLCLALWFQLLQISPSFSTFILAIFARIFSSLLSRTLMLLFTGSCCLFETCRSIVLVKRSWSRCFMISYGRM